MVSQKPEGTTKDRADEIPDDGSNQSMLHPCQTVWAVGQMEDGDLVTAGSDGRVRLWSQDESRIATEDIREVCRPGRVGTEQGSSQAYETRVQESMTNYKPALGDEANQGSGQTEPVTIDIDIR
jgi:hypothetical protein